MGASFNAVTVTRCFQRQGKPLSLPKKFTRLCEAEVSAVSSRAGDGSVAELRAAEVQYFAAVQQEGCRSELQTAFSEVDCCRGRLLQAAAAIEQACRVHDANWDEEHCTVVYMLPLDRCGVPVTCHQTISEVVHECFCKGRMWEAGGYVAENIVHPTRARSDQGGPVIPQEVFDRVAEGNQAMCPCRNWQECFSKSKPGYILENNTLRRLSST
jgi:hypothetical protein